jgi:hypothetical protein
MSGIILISFSQVFAQNTTIGCNETQWTEQLIAILSRGMTMLSWLWIPIAMLGGKLMGNGFIYGEFFNLDNVLFSLWKISSTFANFLVVIFIIQELVSQFWSGGIDKWKMTKYILKMGGWILLANMSWFLIGVTIDISTILTTTISALPSTYISQDNKVKDTILESLGKARIQSKREIKLNTQQCDGQKTIEIIEGEQQLSINQKSDTEILDSILPKGDNINGPLLYLGMSVLKIQDLTNTTNVPDHDLTSWLFVISTRLSIIIVFMIALISIVMVNIIRIIVVWFFVAFAPLLIILYFVWKKDYYENTLLKWFTIQNIVKSIFAPVIATWLMSIWLIMIVIMQWFLQFNNKEIILDNVVLSSSSQWSTIWLENIFHTTIGWDFLWQDDGNQIKNTLTNILLIIFTLLILYGVVKALQMYLKDGIWGEFISNAINLWTNALWSLPMIPLPWGWFWSINAASKVASDKFKDIKSWFSINTSDQDIAIENMFKDKLGMKKSLYSDSYKWLKKLTRSFDNKRLWEADYKNIINAYWKGWIIDYYRWENTTLSSIDSNTKTLETFFKNIAWRPFSLWGNTYNLSSRENWKTTIESFVNENYNKGNNKNLFQKIYQDMGWDWTKLTRWEDFWNKKIQRTGVETEKPTS